MILLYIFSNKVWQGQQKRHPIADFRVQKKASDLKFGQLTCHLSGEIKQKSYLLPKYTKYNPTPFVFKVWWLISWKFKKMESYFYFTCCKAKDALSVLLLYAPVFIFTSGSSALLECPCCYLPYSILFSEFMPIFTRKWPKDKNAGWYKNGCRRKHRHAKPLILRNPL